MILTVQCEETEEILLEHRIEDNIEYVRQGGTIITWCEPKDVDLALSFQEVVLNRFRLPRSIVFRDALDPFFLLFSRCLNVTKSGSILAMLRNKDTRMNNTYQRSARIAP